MDVTMLALRLVHILTGVFWAGTMLFFATMLEPSVRESGPEGARVMQALMRRHYLNLMPLIAALTILTGIDLLRRASGGFLRGWFASAPGATFTAGSVAAAIAFLIGISVMRPAAIRMGRLGAAAAQLPPGPEKDARLAEVQTLRRRMTLSVRTVAGLLAIAVAAMATARYQG